MIIINIGDELVQGVKSNGNGTWLASQAEALSIPVEEILALPDNVSVIKEAVLEALGKTDIVLVTGGLGPTVDDLTREAIADALGLAIYRNEAFLAALEKKVQGFAYEGQKKQADILEGAEIIQPELGLAPGQIIRVEDKAIILLPGVPEEMREMASCILPSFEPFAAAQKTLMFRLAGVREIEIEEKIKEVVDTKSISLLPNGYLADLRVRVLPEEAEKTEREIKSLFGKKIYSMGTRTLEKVTGELLAEKSLSLSAAESCTGGMLGEMITGIPGSSNYFIGSVVSYSNHAKAKILGINSATLERFGAVSETTALEMAQRCRKLFQSDLGISITGIAGPGGGSSEKPVGLAWIGLADSQSVQANKYLFGRNRRRVRINACNAALNLIREYCLQK